MHSSAILRRHHRAGSHPTSAKWALHLGPHHTGPARVRAFPLTTAALVLAATATAQPVFITGLLLAALVAASRYTAARTHTA
jgi:hypothetical protein